MAKKIILKADPKTVSEQIRESLLTQDTLSAPSKIAVAVAGLLQAHWDDIVDIGKDEAFGYKAKVGLSIDLGFGADISCIVKLSYAIRTKDEVGITIEDPNQQKLPLEN